MPRGGRREGAGRKPKLGVLTPITVRLTQSEIKRLNRLIKRGEEGDGPTAAVRAALRAATAPPPKPKAPSAEEQGVNVEALCLAIAAIGAGRGEDACRALASIGEAMGLSSSHKRKLTTALRAARKALAAAEQVPELPIEDEAKRLRARARKENERHPMPVYEDYARQKRAHKYQADHKAWLQNTTIVNAFDEAAGRLEDFSRLRRKY